MTDDELLARAAAGLRNPYLCNWDTALARALADALALVDVGHPRALDTAMVAVAEAFLRSTRQLGTPEVRAPRPWEPCPRIAHESGVVLTCQSDHAVSRVHGTTGGVFWSDDDERIIHTLPPGRPQTLTEIRATADGGGPCPGCGEPYHTHVCLTCSPDSVTPGRGCHNCRHTGMDQTPCGPKETSR